MYVVYNIDTNIVVQVTDEKIVSLSGKLAFAEVEIVPTVDNTQILKVKNIQEKTDAWDEIITETVDVLDGNGQVKTDENGKITKTITKTIIHSRTYNTCDFEIVENSKAIYRQEINEKQQWLDTIYDTQVKQYERCIRLAIPYDEKYGTIKELDQKASEYAKRISELRNLITGEAHV